MGACTHSISPCGGYHVAIAGGGEGVHDDEGGGGGGGGGL